jgi:hypothetical protein
MIVSGMGDRTTFSAHFLYHKVFLIIKVGMSFSLPSFNKFSMKFSWWVGEDLGDRESPDQLNLQIINKFA